MQISYVFNYTIIKFSNFKKLPFKYRLQASELMSYAYVTDFIQKIPFPSTYLRISVS